MAQKLDIEEQNGPWQVLGQTEGTEISLGLLVIGGSPPHCDKLWALQPFLPVTCLAIKLADANPLDLQRFMHLSTNVPTTPTA